jgi:hypothetical protein
MVKGLAVSIIRPVVTDNSKMCDIFAEIRGTLLGKSSINASPRQQ